MQLINRNSTALAHRPGTNRSGLAGALGLILILGWGCANQGLKLGATPDGQAPHGARAALIEHNKTAEAATPAELIAAGDSDRASGNYQKAHRAYVRAHLADPKDLKALERIAYLSLRSDPQDSSRLFQELLSESPGDASLFVGLAYAELHRGRMDAASAALDGALAIDAEYPAAHAAYAIVYDNRQEYPRAQASSQRATDTQEKPKPQLLNNLGVSNLLAGEPAAALDFLAEANRMDPSSALAANNLGLALGFLGRDQAAYDAFRLHGNRGDALNNLGLACYLRGDHESAREHFEAALLTGETDEVRVLHNLERLNSEAVAGVPALAGGWR
ncbi:MAG: tetratricopeptide repeat protein [Myxococcota bacterium]|nr:tetratricopeptide repeat protein [Myxococcota bacterium]